jgi:DNA-binding SARP family transcriptional activator
MAGAGPSDRPMKIRMFGTLCVDTDGLALGPRDLGGAGPKRILELLLLADGRPVPKERLGDLLWGERAGPLHVAATIETYVSVLRQRLRHRRWLVETAPSAYRCPLERVELDLHRFEALATGEPGPHLRSRLHEALAIAEGELLEDEPYAPWVERLRDHYRQQVVELRLTAGRAALADRDWPDGLAHALEGLAIDPLDERHQRLAMIALYGLGRRHAALRHYERCRALLAETFGARPETATDAVRAAIVDQVPPRTLVSSGDVRELAPVGADASPFRLASALRWG